MSYRDLCGILFWIKFSVALIICLTMFGLQAYLVYKKYTDAQMISYFLALGAEIQLPSLDSALSCDASTSKARLEPDDDQFLWGFSVQWDVDDAIKLTDRLGKTAPIFK